MALKKILNLFRKKPGFKIENKYLLFSLKEYKNYFLYIFLTLVFFVVYTTFSNQINNKEIANTSNIKNIIDSEKFLNLKDHFIKKIKSPYSQHHYVIKNNDTIEEILKKFNIINKETKAIVNELKKKKLSNIYPGRELEIILKKNIEIKENSVVSITYPASNTLTIEIKKEKDSFSVKENILQLYKQEVVLRNTIDNNLYSAAVNAGIEPNIIIEFARIYGFEIDFQRDIRKGDTFEIYYEKFVDDNNIVRDTGKVIFASMNVNGRQINLYNFKYKNQSGYYDLNGKSIVKSLMKTPINGARLSSSFGNRKHPILGYTKLHTGTDFAAPSGTPIMASGSGTVTRARWCGGGGNCVKIRHNSTYETVYAHMKSFAKGIKEGRKVKQGRIIGYVGSTGMSTGPHLHYEVIVNGKKVNSQKLKLPSGKILKGDERKDFEISRIKIDLKLNELRNKN